MTEGVIYDSVPFSFGPGRQQTAEDAEVRRGSALIWNLKRLRPDPLRTSASSAVRCPTSSSDRPRGIDMNWNDFNSAAPELAEAGQKLFDRTGVVLVGTIRKGGGPRISPVEPLLAEGRLYLGM